MCPDLGNKTSGYNFLVFYAANVHVFLFWVVKTENTSLVLNSFKLSITVHSAMIHDIKTTNAHKDMKAQ